MAIRYDVSLNEQLRKTVKNYNAKIKRLERRGYPSDLLPEPTSVQQLKEDYTNRSALKRDLKQLAKFNKKGAERILTTPGGVEMTAYRLEELKAQKKIAAASVTRRLNEAKEHEPVVAAMQSNWYRQLQAKQESIKGLNIEMANYEDMRDHLKDIISEIDYTRKAETFYNNFFSMMGIVANSENEEVQTIIEELSKLTPRQLSLAYEKEKDLKGAVAKYHKSQKKYADGIDNDEDQMYVDMADEESEIQIAGSEQVFGSGGLTIERARTIVEQYKDQ